jgi:hypothetical protein
MALAITISKAEALQRVFGQGDVLKVTEVENSTPKVRRSVAQEIAFELEQGAKVCISCCKIHFRNNTKCLVCRPPHTAFSRATRQRTENLNDAFGELNVAEQATNILHEGEALRNAVAQDILRNQQRAIDAGATFPEEIGFLGHATGLVRSLFGFTTPVRPPTNVVIREPDTHPAEAPLSPVGSVVPPTLPSTSHFQNLRPPPSPPSHSSSISSTPRFHPLDVLKQDVSSPVFFGHQNKLGHLFIIGGSTSGKTYAVSWLAQLFHSIRHYKSILYITKRASYLNAGPSFRAMFAEKQVIFLEDWNGRLPELMERLKQTFAQLRQGAGSAFKFSLCIFDDVTAEVTTGKLNLVDFFTTGRHWGTDFWLVLHSVPKFTAGSASILRQSVCAVIAFGQQIAPRLCDIAEYVDKGDAKEAEAYIKSFTNNDTHIGVFLEVGKGGSIYDYIHPFQAGKLEEPSYVGFPVGNPEKWGVLASIPAPPSMPTPSAPPAPKEETPESKEQEEEGEV